MQIAVREELYVFAMLFLGGVASGVLWDMFFPVRSRLGRRRLCIGIADFLLWSVWAVGIFVFNLTVNSGRVRWYALLAILLGSTVYFLTVSRLLRRIFSWIFVLSEKIVRLILKIVLTITAFLYKIMSYIVLLTRRLLAPFWRWGRSGAARVKRTARLTRLVLKKK